MNLEEAREHIGSGVVYDPGQYQERWGYVGLMRTIESAPLRKEDGMITSVNDTYVFVRYAGDQHSKATSPEDLELLCSNSP